MEIKYKRKVINNVTTVDEMVQFINKKVIYKNFNGFRHDYTPKMGDKIVFFKDNGYNVIYNTSVSEIIKKLNKEYGNKGK
jgi:hypothetical protein